MILALQKISSHLHIFKTLKMSIVKQFLLVASMTPVIFFSHRHFSNCRTVDQRLCHPGKFHDFGTSKISSHLHIFKTLKLMTVELASHSFGTSLDNLFTMRSPKDFLEHRTVEPLGEIQRPKFNFVVLHPQLSRSPFSENFLKPVTYPSIPGSGMLPKISPSTLFSNYDIHIYIMQI
jgi:hypothetical protein